MLAQSFLSASDLGITEPQRDALMKTLVLLETGKLTHTKSSPIPSVVSKFSGRFNMANWSASDECGTICCIGGTAEIISGVPFRFKSPPALMGLFYVQPRPRGIDWHDITPAQAATALRSYLTTGSANWAQAVA
jgi:hypothetical protein